MTTFAVEVLLDRNNKQEVHKVRDIDYDAAAAMLFGWSTRAGDGLTFCEQANGEMWFYPWGQVRAITFKEDR